jgi:hypothetical protein
MASMKLCSLISVTLLSLCPLLLRRSHFLDESFIPDNHPHAGLHELSDSGHLRFRFGLLSPDRSHSTSAAAQDVVHCLLDIHGSAPTSYPQ